MSKKLNDYYTLFEINHSGTVFRSLKSADLIFWNNFPAIDCFTTATLLDLSV